MFVCGRQYDTGQHDKNGANLTLFNVKGCSLVGLGTKKYLVRFREILHWLGLGTKDTFTFQVKISIILLLQP